MKHIKFGDILSAAEGSAQRVNFIVHGCNAHGVMGSGLALQIRNRWPAAYESYHRVCKNWDSSSGALLGHVIPVEVEPNLFVLNAITQQNFGRATGVRYVSYEAVQQAFQEVVELAQALDAHVHYPLIGAGLAGGEWSIISSIIDMSFSGPHRVHRTLWINEKSSK